MHPLDSYCASIHATPEQAAAIRARHDERFGAPPAPAPASRAVRVQTAESPPWWSGAKLGRDETEQIVRAAGIDPASLGSTNTSMEGLIARTAVRLGDGAAARLRRTIDGHFGKQLLERMSPPKPALPSAPAEGDWSLDAIKARAARRTAGADDEEAAPSAPRAAKSAKAAKAARPKPPPPPFPRPTSYDEVAANARAYLAWRDGPAPAPEVPPAPEGGE